MFSHGKARPHERRHGQPSSDWRWAKRKNYLMLPTIAEPIKINAQRCTPPAAAVAPEPLVVVSPWSGFYLAQPAVKTCNRTLITAAPGSSIWR
jgi:hypothetical protein